MRAIRRPRPLRQASSQGTIEHALARSQYRCASVVPRGSYKVEGQEECNYSESSDFSFEGRSFGTKSILATCSGLNPAAIKDSAIALCCAFKRSLGTNCSEMASLSAHKPRWSGEPRCLGMQHSHLSMNYTMQFQSEALPGSVLISRCHSEPARSAGEEPAVCRRLCGDHARRNDNLGHHSLPRLAPQP